MSKEPTVQQEVDGQETSLLTACDNLGALNKFGSRREKTKPALKSFDLITALLDIWHDIPVRGHQDDRIGPLTFLESLNVRPYGLILGKIHCTDPHSKWLPRSTYFIDDWIWYYYYSRYNGLH
jgi:hypothetical protein